MSSNQVNSSLSSDVVFSWLPGSNDITFVRRHVRAVAKWHGVICDGLFDLHSVPADLLLSLKNEPKRGGRKACHGWTCGMALHAAILDDLLDTGKRISDPVIVS